MVKCLKNIWILFWLFLLGFSQNIWGQKMAKDTVVGIYIDPQTGDTLPCVSLPSVELEGKVLPKFKRYFKEWTRLRNAVYVTYPYALSASRVMNQINQELVGVTDKAKRKAIIHSHEADLKKNFTSKISNLSVYQGKVLMKLIRRQTGNNCYEIIQEYKGNLTALFWQSVAVVFGSSLKQDYDAEGEDQALEAIAQDVAKMYGQH
ncbi:DUF4294 domain-containing protein [Rhizosphaericola mali]|nr:DUF4294 domain-containing protein [Rhizosphaericola mali]